MKKLPVFFAILLSSLAFSCADNGSGDDAPDAKCTEGCKDGYKITCDNGEIKEKLKCPNGCDAEGNDCKPAQEEKCTPGCEGDILTKCNGNKASTHECTNGCNEDGTDCKNGESVVLCTPSCTNM